MMSANECHGVRRCAEITCKMEEFARLQVRFSITGGTSSVHTVYCKRHSVRQSAALTPNDLTLFTLGWPPYCTSTCVQELFSRVGDVRRIYLQPRPGPAKEEQGRGFRVGYIVLSSSEEVTSALNLCSANEPIPCNVHGLVSLSKWCVEYAAVRTNLKNLEAGVEAQIQAYDSRKEEEGAKRKQAGEPDKEGWITVTRRRPQTQVTHQERKRRKKKELLNFYRFQQRETQRERIADLRRAFEEDKERVAAMRQRRRFKPF